ncbi:MAG: hypothetical protein J0H39_19395 [Alphaproteobacteria bacterium]|nr:hypothetical protein [Alphaproteobacteria bacterium]
MPGIGDDEFEGTATGAVSEKSADGLATVFENIVLKLTDGTNQAND